MKIQKIELKQDIHNFLDYSNFEGDLLQISKTITNIPKKLNEIYPNNPNIQNSHRFSLRADKNYGYNYNDETTVEFVVECWRWETDEEFKKRKETAAKRVQAGKKAVETKKSAQEKRERTLLQTLKAKYE